MRRLRMILAAVFIAAPIAGAFAQAQQPDPPERLITISGEGTVRATPDMAAMTLGVVSEGESAREALSANTEAMAGVLEGLRGEGLEPRDLQTFGFSVEPVYSQPPRDYDHSKPFEQRIVGYRVRNNVTARIRDLDRVGAILDKVITLGANTVSGPSFTVAEPEPLEDQARRAAMRDAIRKGELYAEAAGVALGPILRIDEGFMRPPQPLQGPAMMRMEAADSAVPIESGELTFTAQVSVSWRLAE